MMNVSDVQYFFWVSDTPHNDYYTILCRTSMRYIYARGSHLFPSVIRV